MCMNVCVCVCVTKNILSPFSITLFFKIFVLGENNHGILIIYYKKLIYYN